MRRIVDDAEQPEDRQVQRQVRQQVRDDHRPPDLQQARRTAGSTACTAVRCTLWNTMNPASIAPHTRSTGTPSVTLSGLYTRQPSHKARTNDPTMSSGDATPTKEFKPSDVPNAGDSARQVPPSPVPDRVGIDVGLALALERQRCPPPSQPSTMNGPWVATTVAVAAPAVYQKIRQSKSAGTSFGERNRLTNPPRASARTAPATEQKPGYIFRLKPIPKRMAAHTAAVRSDRRGLPSASRDAP